MSRRARALVVIVAVALVLLVEQSRIRVAYLATLVLVEATTPGVDGPIARLRSDPVVETVAFESGGRAIEADLYRPSSPGRHPAIVLNHGMDEGGRGDPRLVNIADAMARAGFVALVPEYPSLKSLTVRRKAVDEIVDAYRYVEALPRVSRERIGFFGVSYAGGLSVLAACDPRIAERVRFCFSLGGYHDLRRVVVYMMTGMYRDEGLWVFLEPENYGRWVFLLNSVDLVRDSEDRRVLSRIAREKLRDPDGDVSGHVAALGEEGRHVYALMTSDDPKEAASIIDALGDDVRGYFDGLSPRSKLTPLRARLILAHGRDDNMIPFTESVALAAEAAPPAGVRLVLLDSFRHVDLTLGEPGARGRGAVLGEVRRLFLLTYDLVSQGYL